MNAYLFIETRRLDGLKEKFNSFAKYLPGWHGIFVGSNRNLSLIHDIPLLVTIDDINSLYEYNHVLTSSWFWEMFSKYDHVLICQHDSGLLREGIEEFLVWDYVGAPWPFMSYGGNGGLSLRKVETMKKITSKFHFNHQNGNEDIYFSTIMHDQLYNLAPRDVCAKFSVESAFVLGTLGYHFGEDSKRYLGEREKEIILTQYG